MKVTWYFIPNSGSKLTYVQSSLTKDMKFDKEEKKLAIQSSDHIMSRIIDCAKSNSKYDDSLSKYSINELSNKDIINVVWSVSHRKELTNIHHNLELEEN